MVLLFVGFLFDFFFNVLVPTVQTAECSGVTVRPQHSIFFIVHVGTLNV